MPSIKSSQVLIGIGVLILLGIAGYFFFQVLQGTPSAAPGVSKVFSEPHTIGIIYVSQNIDTTLGMKAGLKKLGYTNITFKEFPLDSLATMQDVEKLTKELVSEKVDLIYVAAEVRALGAINATKSMGNDTPIVYGLNFHDPVTSGLAKSFLSSGNNATGVSTDIAEIVQKQLEFLKKIRPNSKKIGVFGKGFVIPAVGDVFLAELKQQAPLLGYEVVEYTTTLPPPKAESAWNTVAASIKHGDIDALYHIGGHFYVPQETVESELATRLQIPMIAPTQDLPKGGHFGYNGDLFASGEQSARMVDKIFHGTKPSDIPLENVEKIFLVLYPVRAQTAGVVFPESILSIASEIVNAK